MSLFQVQLQNVGQGLMDLDPSTNPLAAGTAQVYGDLGIPFGPEGHATYAHPSQQRQVYVMGPKKINRLLSDGETFTDCNYWKRFAYPQVPYDQAFIAVLTDDGSVYSDVEEENTFAVASGSLTITATLADNVVDFVTTYGGPAKFCMISNTGATNPMTVELNGDTNVTFTVAKGETQIFNSGDLAITMLRISSASGTTAEVVASVKSAVNS